MKLRTQSPLAAAVIVTVGLVGLEVALTHPDLLGELVQNRRTSETTGTIVSAAVAQTQTTKGSRHVVRVRYTYSVNGEPHESSRYSEPELGLPKAEAESIVSSLPTGASVPVHFDPAHPSDAVLDEGLHLSSWIPGPLIRRCVEAVIVALAWVAVVRNRR